MKVFRPKPLHTQIEKDGSIGDHNRWTEGGVIAYIKDLPKNRVVELANLVYENMDRQDDRVTIVSRDDRWGYMTFIDVRDWMLMFVHWDYQKQVLVPMCISTQRQENLLSLYEFTKG